MFAMAENCITPITVSSPKTSNSFSSKHNLTGLPRKCKDNSIELHNIIQKWNGFNIEGLELLKRIIDSVTSDDKDSDSNEMPEIEVSKTENVQMLFDELLKIYSHMVHLNEKLNILSRQFDALSQLQEKAMDTEGESIVLSEIIRKSCALSEKMVKCYGEEIKMKRTIIENIAHTPNKDERMFLLAAWTHEPCINRDLHINLKILLMETGAQ